MKLSVVIITFNEEANIEKCLSSVQGIADEIVVVDSFSTDNTEQLCRKYTTQFIQRTFDGYGKQKQFATHQATYDYILSLDADESLSKELYQSIVNAKNSLPADAYSFNRLNFYCNTPIRYCGWYPDKQVRLFNRKKENWNNRNVHETVDLPKGSTVVHLKGDLLHYTCDSIQEHRGKEKKYAWINAHIIAEKKASVSIFTPYVKSVFRFIKTYVIKLGFLDGYYGFAISRTLALSSFHKYYWARQLIRKKTRCV